MRSIGSRREARPVSGGNLKPRHVITVLAALLCLSGIAAAGTKTEAAKPDLRIGAIFAFASLDPAKDSNGMSNVLRDIAYSPIIRMNADGSFSPGLATSWRSVKVPGGRNKGFEFTLRRNARFSDGTPVTASTVKAWLNYFASVNGPNALALGPNPTFETVGKWTVRLRLTTPNPAIPYILSQMRQWGFVAAPKAVAEPTLFATGSWGAGPYKIDPSQTVDGDHYTFIPNPYYYDKASVKWRQIYVKVISNTSTMLQALQAGQLDVVNGDAATAAVAASSGFKVTQEATSTNVLVLSDRNGTMAKPLASLQVRQAINYAIDRKTIVKALFGQYAWPTSEVITSDGFDPKYKNYYPYNPSKAKSLLAAAGYSQGFTLKTLVNQGFGTIGVPLLNAVAKYLEAVGVHVEINAVPGSVFGRSRASFPSFSGNPGVIPMSIWYTIVMHPNAPQNPFHFSDPMVNKLYYAGLRAADPRPYWLQISRRITTQAYFAPIMSVPFIWYSSPKVVGVKPTAEREGMTFLQDWSPK